MKTLFTILMWIASMQVLFAQTESISKLEKKEIQFLELYEKAGYLRIDSIDKQLLYVKSIIWDTMKTDDSKRIMVAKLSKYYNGHKYNNWEGYGVNWSLKIRILESKKLVGEQFKDLSIKILQ